MPTRAEAEAAIAEVEALKKTFASVIVIDHVIPDYYARYPKACMGGWGERGLNITPSGKDAGPRTTEDGLSQTPGAAALRYQPP
jgi:hypothetical protein